MTALRLAVFLDRDGVLNDVVWRDGRPASPRTPEEFQIAGDAPEALAVLKARGYALFVVTNQPDIARGRMAQSALDAIHDRLSRALPVEAIAACTHDDADGCACRKPKPGLLIDLARRYGLDLSQSWMVGDQDRDIACGKAAGCATVLIGRRYNARSGANHMVDNLWQASCMIASGKVGAAVSGG